MHNLTSKSADKLSDEYYRLAKENIHIPAAKKAFMHAAKLLNEARLQDFEQSPERTDYKQEKPRRSVSAHNHDFLRI